MLGRGLRSAAILSGLGLAGYAGARALLGIEPGADDSFFDWKGPTTKDAQVGSARVDLPVKYYRDDSFAGFFGAALEPVRALLPSSELHPVMLPGGRAVVAIFAFNYHDTDIGPYGEIAIAIPCVYGQEPLPLLPLALEAGHPGFGAFVAHLPVTSLVARDGGRVLYGFPKFVADMAFEKQPAYQRVRLSEDGRHILTLTVRQQGIPLKDNRPLITYTVLDGQLIKTTVPTRAVYQLGLLPGTGTLELGEHPIADQLRQLDVDAHSQLAKNYLTRCGILPAGEPIGPAREYVGYIGTDREYGLLTANYGGKVVEVHAREHVPAG